MRLTSVAFGDMPNDLPMLAWAGRSFAVANAHHEVLAAADEVIASNDDDGVAQTLGPLVLSQLEVLAGAGRGDVARLQARRGAGGQRGWPPRICSSCTRAAICCANSAVWIPWNRPSSQPTS